MSAIAFLEILLPSLSLDSPPEMSFDEVLDFFALNLSSAQMTQVERLSDYYDVENLRSFLLGQPMTARGNLPRHRLQEKTIAGDWCIPGTKPFFDAYPDLDSKKKNAHTLMASFLKERSKAPASFVQRQYLFEYRLRHILAFCRATFLERSYEADTEDLSFSVADAATWPSEFSGLARLWQSLHRGPLELEKTISKWKFDYYDALEAHNGPFCFDTILIYFLKLHLLESRKTMRSPQLTHTLERMAKAVQ